MLKDQIPPFVFFALDRLRGFNHEAFIVGGAVRDALLGRPVSDWDVATSASPDGVAEIFQGVRQVRFKGGTTVLVSEGRHYEVTSFRGKDGTIRSDLASRDFTIDAMAYDDLTGAVVDPCHGREDLLCRRVKAVGRASARFEEDPLRILRAARLATDLQFSIDPETETTISRMTPLLDKVAPERIREEMVRILLTLKPSGGFRLMGRLGILEAVLPELSACLTFGQTGGSRRKSVFDHLLETLDRVEAIPHLRLAALFHDVAKPHVAIKVSSKWRFPDHAEVGAAILESVMKRLRFSRKLMARAHILVRYHSFEHPAEEDSDLSHWVARVGRNQIDDLFALRRADLLACELHKENDALDRLQTRVHALINGPMVLTPTDLAIDGQAVMNALGLRPGPKVGKILRELMAYVTEHPSRNDEESLTSLLLEMKGGHGLRPRRQGRQTVCLT